MTNCIENTYSYFINYPPLPKKNQQKTKQTKQNRKTSFAIDFHEESVKLRDMVSMTYMYTCIKGNSNYKLITK